MRTGTLESLHDRRSEHTTIAIHDTRANFLNVKKVTVVLYMEISPGELADKLSILAIKKQCITDPAKLAHVQREYDMIAPLVSPCAELEEVNRVLWDVEDEIRTCESNKDFGPNFVRLARLVYKTNDRRAAIKRAINSGCPFAEEKQYAHYIKDRPSVEINVRDHTEYNGLIRHVAENANVITQVKHEDVDAVKFMFRDLGPAVTIVPVDEVQVQEWPDKHTEDFFVLKQTSSGHQ